MESFQRSKFLSFFSQKKHIFILFLFFQSKKAFFPPLLQKDFQNQLKKRIV